MRPYCGTVGRISYNCAKQLCTGEGGMDIRSFQRRDRLIRELRERIARGGDPSDLFTAEAMEEILATTPLKLIREVVIAAYETGYSDGCHDANTVHR